MNAINRQKFLAELAKLLTFMYEEDRQLALRIYERMFDAVEDEHMLIQGLSSPTRQAVVIARAYDAKERRLSVSSSSKDEDGYQEKNEIPNFVLEINRVFTELFPGKASVIYEEEEQISMFDSEEEEDEDFEEERGLTGGPSLEDTQEFILNLNLDEEPEDEEDTEEPESEEASEQGAAAEPQPKTEAESEDIPADEEEPAEEEVPVEEPVEEESAESDELTGPEEEFSDEPIQPPASPVRLNSVEHLLGFDEEEKPENGIDAEKRSEAENKPGKAIRRTRTRKESVDLSDFAEPVKRKDRETGKKAQPLKTISQPKETEQAELSPKVPILILFLIVAIPVTLALICLLLIPTLLCLGLSVGLIVLGATLIVSAFRGFAVLADIMLLLGAAIVLLAIALLLLWLFLRLLTGAIPDVVRLVVKLCRNWCYEEVSSK